MSSVTCPTWTSRRIRRRWTSPPGWKYGWAISGGPSIPETTPGARAASSSAGDETPRMSPWPRRSAARCSSRCWSRRRKTHGGGSPMMLDPSVLRAPVLDHRGLDLGAARRVRYVLEQSFRYEYDAPVKSLQQRLVIVPPARHGNQYLRAHRLEVDGAQVRRRVRRDADGNVIAWLRAEHVPHAIEFRLAAVVERVRDDGPTVLAAGALRSPRL